MTCRKTEETVPDLEKPRFLEGFRLGDRLESLEELLVTRENIREFASRYDPQPIHLDEDQARESIFGELIASGWHALSLTMGLLVPPAYSWWQFPSPSSSSAPSSAPSSSSSNSSE